MCKNLLAAIAAVVLLCPVAASAVDANAAITYKTAGPASGWYRVKATVTTTTTCTAGTAVIVAVNGSGSAVVDLRGAFTSTHKVKTSVDGATYSSDVTVYPQGGGAGVTSLTAAGAWVVPAETLAGQQFLCLYTSAFTSTPSITVEVSPVPVTAASLGNPGASTVTPKGTTTASAPVSGNLTAATATSVYAGAAGICQVSVSNLSPTIAMLCGQTNVVSAIIGLYTPPLGTYTTSWGYGGAVFCFPASGTPAFSTQVTVCP